MIDEVGGGASRTTDPAAGTSAATDVSLREYLMSQIDAAEKRSDLRFEAMKEQVDAAFTSSQRAIDKADIATEKRFEGVNEFRAALSDQATRFVTTQTLESLSEKLQAAIDRNRDDLDALSRRVDLRQGEVQGSRVTWSNVVGIIAAIGAVLGILAILGTYVATH